MEKKMQCFVVVKEGVYLQNVWGPYSTEEEACTAADKLVAEDADDYHTWSVQSLSKEKALVSLQIVREGYR